jgi:stalled ribosome rescue protein Dom34
MTKHVAVWIDHKEAHIFRIHPEQVGEAQVTAPHQHHKREPAGDQDPPEVTRHFFRAIRRSLEGAREIILMGSSDAKLDFLRYLHKHDRALEPRIVGIETIAPTTEEQLIAYARAQFKQGDRMR